MCAGQMTLFAIKYVSISFCKKYAKIGSNIIIFSFTDETLFRCFRGALKLWVNLREQLIPLKSKKF